MPIRGTRAMTPADAMRPLLATRVLPVWKSRSTRTEWMGIPSPGRKKSPVVESKGLEGGSMLELSRTGMYVTYPYLESHESREPVMS